MTTSIIPTGETGSAPGTLALSDWKKWGKAALYLVGSAAIVGALNAALGLIGSIDFTSLTLVLPMGIEVNGGQLGVILTNLCLYLIELITKDSRK